MKGLVDIGLFFALLYGCWRLIDWFFDFVASHFDHPARAAAELSDDQVDEVFIELVSNTEWGGK